ncbi:hypothetical protein AAG570_011149 [Ranatra chinensis]|uniref:Uncharacterized protein n=1 Tax=Ranatra chinensis TaxID=642074 RepID=A0ABD0YVZ2_9HEMI
MARFTLEMLEGMAYSDILRLAKERNVSTVRKKKEDSTGDGQKEFRKASIQGLAGGDNGVRDKETRRSTFLVKPNGLPQENNEADNNKSIRRSTFLVKLEGLPKDNNETENKENMRRSTFLIKPEGFPEENDAENEENKRRSTFLIKPDDLPEENIDAKNKRNTRRSTFLIKPEDEQDEFVTPKSSPFIKTTVASERRESTRRSIHGRKISSSASKENIQKKDMAKTPKQMVVKPFQRGPVKVSATAKTPIINKNTPQARSSLKPKMPNFSAIHQRQFDRMESLVDHKKRTAMRAIHFFSPPLNRRANIKNDELAVQLPKGRFFWDTMIGFKQKLVRSKSFIPVPVAPTLAKSTSGGATPKLETRSSLASRLHKKSTSVDKLREKERFVIQGVRANRRFLLQMQSRNIT